MKMYIQLMNIDPELIALLKATRNEKGRLKAIGQLTALLENLAEMKQETDEDVCCFESKVHAELAYLTRSPSERRIKWEASISCITKFSTMTSKLVGQLAIVISDYVTDPFACIYDYEKVKLLRNTLDALETVLQTSFKDIGSPSNSNVVEFAYLLTRKSALKRHLVNVTPPEPIDLYRSDYSSHIKELDVCNRCCTKADALYPTASTLIEHAQIKLGLLQYNVLQIIPRKRQTYASQYLYELRDIESCLERAVDRDPDSDIAHLALSTFYRYNFRSYEAIESFKVAIAKTHNLRRILRESYIFAEAILQIWYRDPTSFYVKEHLEDVATIISATIEAGYDNSRILLAQIFVLSAKGEDIDDELISSLFLENRVVDLNVLLDQVHVSPDTMDNLLVKAFAEGTDSSAMWARLGTYYLDFRNDEQRAKLCYEVAIRADHNNAIALTNLARVLVARGDDQSLRKAQSCLDRVRKSSDLRFNWWRGIEVSLREAKSKLSNPDAIICTRRMKAPPLSDITSLKELFNYFHNINLDPVNRGFEFERVIFKLCELTFGIAKPRFKVKNVTGDSQDIDVFFIFKGDDRRRIPFYTECKWHKTKRDRNDVQKLYDTLGSIQYGLFISMSGFTEAAVNATRLLAHRKPILLIDGEEMLEVFNAITEFKMLIDFKLRCFEMDKDPYVRLDARWKTTIYN